MVWYEVYKKFSIPVKALPNLVLYGKYGTQGGLKTKDSTYGTAQR